MRHKIAIFERATAVDILLALLTTDRLQISKLVEIIGRPQISVTATIPKLKELGLVNDQTTPYPIKRFISLTEKGRRVAGKLAEIEGILGGP